jgi:hypothetical protein
MYTSRIITSTAITRFRTPPRISRLLIWALLRNERQREHDQEYHHQNSDDQVESPTHRLAPSYAVATWPQYIPCGTPAKQKGLRNATSHGSGRPNRPRDQGASKGKDRTYSRTTPGSPQMAAGHIQRLSARIEQMEETKRTDYVPAQPLRTARSIENEKAAPRKERRPVRDADATSLTTSCRPCRLASRALPPRARPPPRRW